MNGFLIGFDTKMPAHTYRILPIDVDDVVLNRLTHFFQIEPQKLTLTVKRNRIKGTEYIISNFDEMNTSVLRAFGVIPEEDSM